MKRPWMPLYVGDYLASTGHLTATQHGSYLLLIMHYWVNGKLPTNERQLAAIAKMTPEQWSDNCYTLAGFFDRDWRHRRIEEELEKAKSISEKRSLAGLKSAWNRRDRNLTLVQQMPTHSHSHIDKRLTEGRFRKEDK